MPLQPITIDMTACPACDGAGCFRHPAWGSYNCPEPTVDCDFCDGEGSVPEAMAREYDPRTWEEIKEDIACERYHALREDGEG